MKMNKQSQKDLLNWFHRIVYAQRKGFSLHGGLLLFVSFNELSSAVPALFHSHSHSHLREFCRNP